MVTFPSSSQFYSTILSFRNFFTSIPKKHHHEDDHLPNPHLSSISTSVVSYSPLHRLQAFLFEQRKRNTILALSNKKTRCLLHLPFHLRAHNLPDCRPQTCLLHLVECSGSLRPRFESAFYKNKGVWDIDIGVKCHQSSRILFLNVEGELFL